MLALSFLANCLIVFPVSAAMLRGARSMTDAFGADTVVRRTLASVYLGIGTVSLAALGLMALGRAEVVNSVALGLLPMQIIYKLITVIAVGWASSVVRVNLGVVILRSITLATLLR